ncbi:hypothetical protein ACIBP6_44510 [Nonomuraea terrae]|uniref:hypothetical protein n=1 Tax=Nonomuraea terrae TaxID=2530383 RepID=UPI003791D7C1
MNRLALSSLTLACALVAAPALAATPAAAAPALRGCYDGTCQFTFTKPVKFRVAKKYGLAWVRVAKVWSDWAGTDVVQVTVPNGNVLMSEGASGSANKLNFRVVSITDQGAKIRFTG